MRIGIDIDGVLYAWADAANHAVMAKFGIPDPGPHTCWTWLKDTITPDQWRWVWTDEGSAITFGQMERIYPDAAEAFGALLASGNECHFVTHRDPARCGAPTALFLAKHFPGLRWAGLHVLEPTVPKHSLMGWDVFIDDKPSTVLDMLDFTEAHVFMPARPWNTATEGQGGESVPEPRFHRYRDPWDIVKWVVSR